MDIELRQKSRRAQSFFTVATTFCRRSDRALPLECGDASPLFDEAIPPWRGLVLKRGHVRALQKASAPSRRRSNGASVSPARISMLQPARLPLQKHYAWRSAFSQRFNSIASSAAAVSACFLLRPLPWPRTTSSQTACTTNVFSCSGPL